MVNFVRVFMGVFCFVVFCRECSLYVCAAAG